MQIDNLTIDYLRQCYKNKAFTPSELIDHVLEKAKEYTEKNIWIHQLNKEQIESYIKDLDLEEIDELPLWGIPFVIKDNIDLAGTPTTAGCEAFAYTPTKHAFVVEQLITAGAIPIGKANMDQFATGLVGVRSPEKWGACKNAFDNEYISGGSSSGSAVAVSLGLASFSLGTDTAGSGRVPAALNNIVGLKPTKGLLSCTGVVPACKSLDCVSIFATTCDDANKVFNVTAQFDKSDAYARKNISTNKNNYGNYTTSFKFAVPLSEQLEFFSNSSAKKQFEDSVEALTKLGGEKVTLDFSPFFDAAKLLYSGPWVAERFVATEKILTQNPESMLDVIRTIIGSQQDTSAADTFKAFYQLQAYKQQADQIFELVDILVTPTVGTTYTQKEVIQNPIQLNSNLGYYTNYMNLLDYSAIAIPTGFLADTQLPYGMTLVGKAFDDSKLLSLAQHWQQHVDLPLGATDTTLPQFSKKPVNAFDFIDVVVCGAHLDGLPLNWQLQDRHAKFIEKTHTTSKYRFYALAGGPPFRPGLIRDVENGSAIEVEVWRVPSSEFGSFVAGIPQPLGIGKVELEDGRWVTSFICEGYAIDDAEEITRFGGWRAFISSKG